MTGKTKRIKSGLKALRKQLFASSFHIPLFPCFFLRLWASLHIHYVSFISPQTLLCMAQKQMCITGALPLKPIIGLMH